MGIKVLAFSLVELMVVIAIVALLAAVSVPAYKDYIIKSRISSAMAQVDKLRQMQIDYFNKTGSFTTGSGLGLTTQNSNAWEVVPGGNAYITNYAVNVVSCPDGSQRAEVGATINPTTTGLPGSLYFYTLTKEVNGIFVTTCFTHASTSSTAVASRPYAPANCSTLLALWADLATTCSY